MERGSAFQAFFRDRRRGLRFEQEIDVQSCLTTSFYDHFAQWLFVKALTCLTNVKGGVFSVDRMREARRRKGKSIRQRLLYFYRRCVHSNEDTDVEID